MSSTSRYFNSRCLFHHQHPKLLLLLPLAKAGRGVISDFAWWGQDYLEICLLLYLYLYIYIYIYIYKCVFLCLYKYLSGYIYIYIYLCIFIYTYMYIYLKIWRVIPISKTGKKDQTANCGQITTLPLLRLFFEKLAHKRMF